MAQVVHGRRGGVKKKKENTKQKKKYNNNNKNKKKKKKKKKKKSGTYPKGQKRPKWHSGRRKGDDIGRGRGRGQQDLREINWLLDDLVANGGFEILAGTTKSEPELWEAVSKLRLRSVGFCAASKRS